MTMVCITIKRIEGNNQSYPKYLWTPLSLPLDHLLSQLHINFSPTNQLLLTKQLHANLVISLFVILEPIFIKPEPFDGVLPDRNGTIGNLRLNVDVVQQPREFSNGRAKDAGTGRNQHLTGLVE